MNVYRASIMLLALALVILAIGFHEQRSALAAQHDDLLRLRIRIETQQKFVQDNAIYIPFLEKRLGRYEAGSPADWAGRAGPSRR